MALIRTTVSPSALNDLRGKGFTLDTSAAESNPVQVTLSNNALSVPTSNMYYVYIYGLQYSGLTAASGIKAVVLYDDGTVDSTYGGTVTFNSAKKVVSVSGNNRSGDAKTLTFTT